MKKVLLTAACFSVLAAFSLFAKPSKMEVKQQKFPDEIPQFVESWKESELDSLNAGEIVIRNIKRTKKITLPEGMNPYSDKMIKIFEETNPCYLAEIIFKLPVEGNDSVMEQAVKIFSDASLYREIIYTDERENLVKPLFNEVDIHGQTKDDSRTISSATLKLDMLSDFDVELATEISGNGFFFELKNTTPIKWKFINAVKPEKMLAIITCFEYKGYYYVYSLGGIRAPQIPFLTSEINYQFITRINGFTLFYISKFDITKQ